MQFSIQEILILPGYLSLCLSMGCRLERNQTIRPGRGNGLAQAALSLPTLLPAGNSFFNLDFTNVLEPIVCISFQNLCSATSCFYLEISQGRSIYTMEIGEHQGWLLKNVPASPSSVSYAALVLVGQNKFLKACSMRHQSSEVLCEQMTCSVV